MGLIKFFKNIAASIEANIIEEDLEADLRLVEGNGLGLKAAELEFTRYRSGHSDFEIEIKTRSGIPEGDEAVIMVLGVEVARVEMKRLETDVCLDTQQGDEVPPIKAGDKAELMHNGVVIAHGLFRPD